MRATRVWAGVVALLTLLVTVGCETDTATISRTADPTEIRAELQALSFFSQGKVDPWGNKGASATGHLYSGKESVNWGYSDLLLQLAESYQVDGTGRIVATDTHGKQIEGKYDRVSTRLKWDGRWYVSRWRGDDGQRQSARALWSPRWRRACAIR